MNRQAVIDILQAHAAELRSQHGAVHLSLFGSVARDEASAESDVDLLVELDPAQHIGLFGFCRLQQRLEELLGTKVDLVTAEALKPQLRARIMNELVRAA